MRNAKKKKKFKLKGVNLTYSHTHKHDPSRFKNTCCFVPIFCLDDKSRIVRKPDFCLGENKGADQLRGNREADQRLCFRYSDSTIPLLLKSEISSF